MSGHLGLDLSLTGTGVALESGTFTIRPKCFGAERLAFIEDRIAEVVSDNGITLVAMEGYAFGRPNQAHQVGELGGVVRLKLWRMGVPFVVIPPASLKKYATGKGNANKDAMLEAAIRRFGFEGHGNDEADAWLLLQAALCAYGKRQFTAYQAEAIEKIAWPGECVWRAAS